MILTNCTDERNYYFSHSCLCCVTGMSANLPPLVRLLRVFCPFGMGCVVSYSFSNPDNDNVYDVFPVQKSKNCFISGYKVCAKERTTFEDRWKKLARFYQKQDGYLFNKLIRSSDVDGNWNYFFIDFNQWSSGDSFKIASSRAAQTDLISSINESRNAHINEKSPRPLMFKTVVDDTSFTPSEVLQARSPQNIAARLSSASTLD